MTGSSSSADGTVRPAAGGAGTGFPDRLVGLVEDGLRALVADGDGDPPAFEAALRYPLEAGGKRLRPVLLLATVEALRGDPRHAVPTAVALEAVHTFSLVHDDLPALDDDDLRRGRPTTHVTFGEDVAILVGDALLNRAYRLVLERQDGPPERRLAALAVLSAAVDGMIRGQYLDLRPDGDLDVAQLRRISRLKTGCLIEAAVACALALEDVPDAVAAPYRALAAELGYGFQLVDDVLDATGSASVLGKRGGGDAVRGKGHVAVLGLAGARELLAASETRVAGLLDAVPGDATALRAIAERIYRRDR